MTRCAVCEDALVNDGTKIVLPCHHSFHRICLGISLRNSEACPECQQPVGNTADYTEPAIYMEYLTMMDYLDKPPASRIPQTLKDLIRATMRYYYESILGQLEKLDIPFQPHEFRQFPPWTPVEFVHEVRQHHIFYWGDDIPLENVVMEKM